MNKIEAICEAWLSDVVSMSAISRKSGITLEWLCNIADVNELCGLLGWQGMPMGSGTRTVRRLCRIAMMYKPGCPLAQNALLRVFT